MHPPPHSLHCPSPSPPHLHILAAMLCEGILLRHAAAAVLQWGEHGGGHLGGGGGGSEGRGGEGRGRRSEGQIKCREGGGNWREDKFRTTTGSTEHEDEGAPCGAGQQSATARLTALCTLPGERAGGELHRPPHSLASRRAGSQGSTHGSPCVSLTHELDCIPTHSHLTTHTVLRHLKPLCFHRNGAALRRLKTPLHPLQWGCPPPSCHSLSCSSLLPRPYVLMPPLAPTLRPFLHPLSLLCLFPLLSLPIFFCQSVRLLQQMGGHCTLRNLSELNVDKTVLIVYLDDLSILFVFVLSGISVLKKCPRKMSRHRAMDDVLASIEELRFFRRSIFNPM